MYLNLTDRQRLHHVSKLLLDPMFDGLILGTLVRHNGSMATHHHAQGSGSGFQMSQDPDPVSAQMKQKKIAERSLKVIYQKKT